MSGNCLDLLLTDVPGVVNVSVGPPIGSSDHNVLNVNIRLDSTVRDFTLSRTVYLKSRVVWDAVRADVASIRWRDIYSANCPALALNDALLKVLHARVPSKKLKVRSRYKPWFNDECRGAFRLEKYSQVLHSLISGGHL